MKHTTSRMLFAYWDALRGDHPLPDRQDIQPAAIRHVLADTFILSAPRREEPKFRLTGTRLNALFGRDLKGRAFRGLWEDDGQQEADDFVKGVVSDTIGLVAGLNGYNENGSVVPLELLILPLRHRARSEARVLGSLSPNIVPSWAGLVPLRRIETTTLRIIQPDLPQDRFGIESRPETSERRDLFVVHEGGRP